MEEIAVPQKTIIWCEATLASRQERMLDLHPLRVEASHRCFYRVKTQQGSRVLMDSPPALERNDYFVGLAQVFYDHDIPVPRILAADQDQGLFLLTDLGDQHLENCYATGERQPALQAAIDMLPKLAQVTDPLIEPYSRDRFAMELDIFSQWFANELIRHPLESSAYSEIKDVLINNADMQPKGCVHRDYHCRNLLYSQGQLGIVDFQDALHGPILYDIASLLRDCYYTFDESEIQQWLNHFVQQVPVLAPFETYQVKEWFDLLAIQRQLKAIGIFARLHLRDGKSSHLQHIMPLLQRLQTLATQYDQLQPLVVQLTNCTKSANAKLNTIL